MRPGAGDLIAVEIASGSMFRGRLTACACQGPDYPPGRTYARYSVATWHASLSAI
jgi:hypothetical protein